MSAPLSPIRLFIALGLAVALSLTGIVPAQAGPAAPADGDEVVAQFQDDDGGGGNETDDDEDGGGGDDDDDVPAPPPSGNASDDDGFDGGDDDDGFEEDDGGDDDDGAPVAPPPAPAPSVPEEDDDGVDGEDDDDTVDDDDDLLDDFRQDQAIVRLAADADIEAFNQRNGTRSIAAIPSRDIHLLQLAAGDDDEVFISQVVDDDDIVWAELNFTSQAPEGRPNRFFVDGITAPSPADLSQTYAPALLGVEAAWSCTMGAGVTVAVIDTGVDADHPELIGGLSANGINMLDSSATVADVGNGIDEDGDGFIDEMTGHGTHVAGIIRQVAPQAMVLPIKALNSDGVGDAFDVAAAIFYAIDNDAQVINLSLGSTHNAIVVQDAVSEAVNAGRVVVAAAGNLNTNDTVEYPAAGGFAIGVASTNANDRKSLFSSYNELVTVSSPGSAIVSAFPGGGYVSWSGTSMATPWVSGAAALLLTTNPDWEQAEVSASLAQTSVNIDILNPGFAGQLGAGRIEVEDAAGCGGVAGEEAPAAAADPIGGATIVNTNGAGANCRAGADPEANIITLLPEGSSVALNGEPVDGWQPVFCAGLPGFVFADFVAPVDASLSG